VERIENALQDQQLGTYRRLFLHQAEGFALYHKMYVVRLSDVGAQEILEPASYTGEIRFGCQRWLVHEALHRADVVLAGGNAESAPVISTRSRS